MLDRDGVINRQIVGGYVTSWEPFEFMPGVLDAIAMLSCKFKHIFVVTNQRCVGKGILSQQGLDYIHSRMKAEIEAHGGKIDRILCCTSTDDKDPYRKPNAGMFHELCYYCPDVRPEKALMIGDSDSDIEFAQNCGVDSIKVKKYQC
ncbi:MAG: HAD-IIIA family hydrolase [Bacteroidales bacterium]|nr:HAD-IIIA family hydrolase [Bacteroidales bacterium]